MPLHIACMYHLEHLNSKLFLLAHELVDKEPESAISWYAVGMWYMCIKKFQEARTYFRYAAKTLRANFLWEMYSPISRHSKTSLMDPRFAPAWIAFAHAFSFEGEHEHAVTAYSTCARLYTGSHLPLMFVGMEHIILSNRQQAEEALFAANHMCDADPLLLNERGVMAFTNDEYVHASYTSLRHFRSDQYLMLAQLRDCSETLCRGVRARTSGTSVPESVDPNVSQPRHGTEKAWVCILYPLCAYSDD